MIDDHSMIGRVLAVMDVCLQRAEPVSLRELADATGLPKPTAWRIAQSLVQRRLLERTRDGYSGGSRLASMGTRVVEKTALRSAVIPHLAELHNRTAAVVWVVDVRSPTEWPTVGTVYGTAAAETGYSESWEHDPNKPAVLASALGILALAKAPERADKLIERTIPRLTRFTVVEPHRIHSALQRAQERGEVVEHETFVLGWSCLTVPIIDAHTAQMTAVLGVADRTPRFDSGRLLHAAHASAHAMGNTLNHASA